VFVMPDEHDRKHIARDQHGEGQCTKQFVHCRTLLFDNLVGNVLEMAPSVNHTHGWTIPESRGGGTKVSDRLGRLETPPRR